MPAKKLPDLSRLITTLRSLITVHPLKPAKATSLTFIYMGLHEAYPGLVTYGDFSLIAKRRKTPEDIAEAILTSRS
jgi:hypothetical protein